ncbi:ion channel [Flavobacterium sp. '19STA2R22 D10 B1']|uniref:ion channel n=1 Tax=Flavobacterium aerium TaxID=3037261 RepID=UPI00278C2799|nr:ion channel [Flavobacterium sp. '19STA2R22 D10 B1']
MALLRKINLRAKKELDTGFGVNASNYGGRFVNKDGKSNIEKRGGAFLNRISWYHTMLELPTWKFLGLIFTFYILVNFIFACIYYAIGIEYLDGINTANTIWAKFGGAYFFSAQTFTTVGYGHISPVGFLASAVSAAEALTGLLSFAIATGLFYGRFSRPVAYVKFSHHAVIAPYKEGTALMIRIVPYKNTTLTDAEVKITLGMSLEENGKVTNNFYQLNLELAKINALSLSWTLVHPITEDSPIYNFTADDFTNIRGEILVFLKTFDDMFSNTVAARSSYTFKEIKYGAKFAPMYERNEKNTKTVLHIDQLDDIIAVDLDIKNP